MGDVGVFLFLQLKFCWLLLREKDNFPANFRFTNCALGTSLLHLILPALAKSQSNLLYWQQRNRTMKEGSEMNKEFLLNEITRAQRARDKTRLSILRMVKGEIDSKEKDSKRDATDEEVLALFKKVLKQTGETLEGSIKVNTNAERTALLTEQVSILGGYLPKSVTGDELAAIVDGCLVEMGATTKRDMGRVISAVNAAVNGNCDKAEVAKLVGAKLT